MVEFPYDGILIWSWLKFLDSLRHGIMIILSFLHGDPHDLGLSDSYIIETSVGGESSIDINDL